MFIRLISNNNLTCTPDNSTSWCLTYSRKLKRKKVLFWREEGRLSQHSILKMAKPKELQMYRCSSTGQLSTTEPWDWPMHSLPGCTTPISSDLLLMFLWPTIDETHSKVHSPLVILASYPVSRKLVSELVRWIISLRNQSKKCKKKTMRWGQDRCLQEEQAVSETGCLHHTFTFCSPIYIINKY